MMVTKSMNRTTANVLFCLTSLIGTAAGQEGKADPVRNLQSTAVNELVAVIAKAEAAMTSLRMTISTAGQLPGGLQVTTRGELRVLPSARA